MQLAKQFVSTAFNNNKNMVCKAGY